MKHFAAVWLLSAIACSQVPKNVNHVVEIRNMKFNPQILAVQPGDTVTWINSDIVDHDVTDLRRKAWRSGPLRRGETWQKMFRDSADYYCSIHVVMTGKIKVN